MAIANDLSHLPRAGDGLQPDAKPRFVQVLVEKWMAENEEAGEKPHAIEGTRFRHSDAGKCARMLGYKAAGLPKSNPMDESGTMNTRLGTILHDAWQEALQARYGDVAAIEVVVGSLEADRSGHVDAVIRWDDPADVPLDVRGPGWSDEGRYTIAYELKSQGGWGFKSSIGRAQRGKPAEGPKTDHLLQGAINALDVDADELVIGYIGKEALGKQYKVEQEIDRFLAEWTFTREQFEPVARDELQRVEGAYGVIDEGLLPRRICPDMPPGAEVDDPSKGTWTVIVEGKVTDTGSVWQCNYCDYQDLCGGTPKGRIPVESVVHIGDPLEGLEALADGSGVA